ncbi:MAG TPA: FG-GAP-like repeat-containing protein [Candidatus Paceibacterota bacterium]|nr:FG-GAP-like repeat-containing protein [Candidatus Paceibacterota bacterium]
MKKYLVLSIFVLIFTFSLSKSVLAENILIPAYSYEVGSFPQFVTSGDFNGDTKLDLAVIGSSHNNNVSILLGTGSGTFGSVFNYGVGDTPSSITTGDFNGDTKLDLAVTNYHSDTVSILLGNGNGTFKTKVDYGTRSSPQSVTTGDFNGDTFLDLAVVNTRSNNVSILSGTGSGTFGLAVNYEVGNYPYFITTGDFNGDTKLDLVVANFGDDNVSILFGAVDGIFDSADNYGVGDAPQSVTTGDFNGDTFLDLAVTNSYSNNVSILSGTGSGTFSLAVNYEVGSFPRFVTSGDFNGDTKLDLVVANREGESISILFGSIDGIFSSADNYNVGIYRSFPSSITTGDFNGDTFLDLAVANSSKNNDVTILLGGLILSYSGNFIEPSFNDGSILGSRTIYLANDTFKANEDGTLTEGVHYTLTNKPAGLTSVMTVDEAGETATLTFTGNATNHDDANDVNNLTITFLDGAFTNTATASDVANYTDDNGIIDFFSSDFQGTTILYGVDGAAFDSGSSLYILDPSTGNIIGDPVGSIGYHINGMDFDPTSGILYGVTSYDGDGEDATPQTLFTIDTETGIATIKGTVSYDFTDIAFRSDGKLYAPLYTRDGGALMIIDKNCPEEVCEATNVAWYWRDITGAAGIAFDSEDNLYIFESRGFFKVDSDTGEVLESIPYTTDTPEDELRAPAGNLRITAAKFNGDGIVFASRNNNSSDGVPSDLVMIDILSGKIISTGENNPDMSYMTALAFKLIPTPTCSDGIQNQDETGIDKGGVCTPPQSTHHTTFGSYAPGFTPTFVSSSPTSSVPPTDCLVGYLFSPSTGKACGTTSAPTTPKFTFTKNLKYLQIDNEVKELQKFLNTHGYQVSTTGAGSLGNETTKFGSLTQKALIKFQLANKISPAIGYFGPITRALVNSLNR